MEKVIPETGAIQINQDHQGQTQEVQDEIQNLRGVWIASPRSTGNTGKRRMAEVPQERETGEPTTSPADKNY